MRITEMRITVAGLVCVIENRPRRTNMITIHTRPVNGRFCRPLRACLKTAWIGGRSTSQNRSIKKALRLLTAIVLVSVPIKAATPGLPSPEALLQRHIDAIGGTAALREVQSLTFKGEISLPFVKAKAPIEFLFEAPDRFYCMFRYHHAFFGFLKVPFLAKRQAECGYDGTNGWLVDFESNVEPLHGADEAFFRGLLDKFSSLCFLRGFPFARTLGVERFADRDCYRVVLVFPFGEHAFEFYDAQSGLLAGAIYPFETDDALVNVQTTYLDFRRVGQSLKLPFRMECEVGDQHYSIQANEVRTDITGVRVPASKLKSAPPPLPLLKPAAFPAREVIERFVTACGGTEALRKHTSLKLSGSYGVPGAHGFTNRVEVFAAPTNRFAFTLPIPKGVLREGCDGEHCWRIEGKEINLAAGKELAQKLAERQFLAHLHAPEGFRSLDTVGTITQDGHDCYELLAVRQSGEVFEEFYDVQTGLLRGRHTTDERTGGTLRLLAAFDDYRRFGDWMLASRQSYKLTGGPQVLTITNAQWDIAPGAVFDMPADVKSHLPARIAP